MRIHDESATRVLDAELSLEEDIEWAVTIESRGGRRRGGRNTEYIQALRVVLARFKELSAWLDEVLLSSKSERTNNLTENQRRFVLDNYVFPIELASVHDIETLRLDIGRASSGIARQPGARGGGNAEKRITLKFRIPENRLVRREALREYLISGNNSVFEEHALNSEYNETAVNDVVATDEFRVAPLQVGRVYTPADECSSLQSPQPFEVDPSIVERGLQGHQRTQNVLADFVRAIGFTPRLPTGGEPEYDVAWECGCDIFVAEVKSCVPENQEKQLRLGLGQVLRYRSLLERKYQRPVHAVLVAETVPEDHSWYDLCLDLGVWLLYPEGMEMLQPQEP